VDLQELPVVHDPGDHGVHVVRLVRRVGDEAVQLGVDVGDLEDRRVVAGRGHRRVQVVGRQVGQ
jgi:hypothetical protein